MESILEVVKIKQVVQNVDVSKAVIKSPEDGTDLAYSFIGDDDREIFLVICLDTKNGVSAIHRAHIGTVDATLVMPREVFKVAILNNATSIIVAHNHPAGSIQPSENDIMVTKRLLKAGEILGIPVVDHLIVCYKPKMYFSFKERGYI